MLMLNRIIVALSTTNKQEKAQVAILNLNFYK